MRSGVCARPGIKAIKCHTVCADFLANVSQFAGKLSHWTDEEVEALIHLIEQGLAFTDIVSRLGRHPAEVEIEATFLGVSLPRHEAVPVSTHTGNSSGICIVAGSTFHFAPGVSRQRPRE